MNISSEAKKKNISRIMSSLNLDKQVESRKCIVSAVSFVEVNV